MAQFDQTMQREYWVFENTGIPLPRDGNSGKKCLKRGAYMWVEYDGNPDRYLVPRNHAALFHDPEECGNKVNPEADGTVIAGFEIVDNGMIWAMDDRKTAIHEFHII